MRKVNNMRNPIPFLPVLAAVAISPACIIHNPPPPTDPYGDIAFDWSFAGVQDCDEAGVDEVDIVVLRAGTVVMAVDGEPCAGRGLVLTDILEGVYEVQIDAYDRDSELLYAGAFTVRVRGETTNDAGLVELDDLRRAPPPLDGSLGLFWSFLYPTNDVAEIDCGVAGVSEVDVSLTPFGAGPSFVETHACTDEGIVIEPLPEGRYELRLQGFGPYQGSDVFLYDSGPIIVEVFGGEALELGDVELARVAESFSDFDVAWGFLDETCESAGVDSVTLTFLRVGFAQPEDVLTVDCLASNVVRRTFVPGTYVVSATATGMPFTWIASTTVELPPDTVAEVTLGLNPSP